MSKKLPCRKIGVESCHGFGDCLFNLPLIRELSTKNNTKIGVAVKPACKDAFYNIPWIDEIVECTQMWGGLDQLKKLGYETTYQITQNVKFQQFREHDQNHSLIDTPLLTGIELGLANFDNRPIFIPTEEEILKTNSILNTKPTIAIESVFNSIQSWANDKTFIPILEKFAKTHRILWLSNHGAPERYGVDNMLRYSRRECIMCLRAVDILFSVGSGFFCSSLALQPGYQPKKIICLWIDEMYKYEAAMLRYKWHDNIVWVHNHDELLESLHNT